MFYILNVTLLINNIVCACLVDSPLLSTFAAFAAVVGVAGMLCKRYVK